MRNDSPLLMIAAVCCSIGLFGTTSAFADTNRGVTTLSAYAAGRADLGSANSKCKERSASEKSGGQSITIALSDCDTSGSFTIPGFQEFGSSRPWGMWTRVCESAQSIVPKSKACPAASFNPSGLCRQASSTFWYIESTFKAIMLDGSGAYIVGFNSNTFPISFASPTRIVMGKRYGLCVLSTGGVIIQDDFATGNGVAPTGDSISLTMALTSAYTTFMFGETIDLYLESKP
jgi:hypothetical protein